jgi:hypothetical protein
MEFVSSGHPCVGNRWAMLRPMAIEAQTVRVQKTGAAGLAGTPLAGVLTVFRENDEEESE